MSRAGQIRFLSRTARLYDPVVRALGFPRLGLKARPTQMAELQASAATGQSRLMHAYEEAFTKHGIEVALGNIIG